MIIVDSHQDLAWNMLTFGRDYTHSVEETRQLESEGQTPLRNGDTLLGWPEYQRGQIAVIFATLFAAPERHNLGEWDKLTYANTSQAHSIYHAQLDSYQRLVDEHPDQFQLVQSLQDLEHVLTGWETPEDLPSPVGLVMLMEGAEGVRQPSELEEWWHQGVRLIGPAWAGTRERELGLGMETCQVQSRQCGGRWTDDPSHSRAPQDSLVPDQGDAAKR